MTTLSTDTVNEMEKLIKAYLKHINHYLAGNEIFSIRVVFDGDESLYDIEV